MPSSPIQIRLATTDINEFATWTTKDGSLDFNAVDPLYAGVTYTQIQNPIPKAYDYYKNLSGVGTLRNNETATVSTGGGNFLGGTASVVEDQFLATSVGGVNKINIKNLVSTFMTARNQNGLTFSLILNAKQDELGQIPTSGQYTEANYLQGAASATRFDANTFYKASNWITFHSKEADTTVVPSIASNTSISFRKSFHHGFIAVNNTNIAGISQGVAGASIRSVASFDWNKVQGLSANCLCVFAERTSPTNEAISASGTNPSTISASNKTLLFTGISNLDAIFTNTTNTTLFNAPFPNTSVSARINWGDAGYSTKIGGTTPVYNIRANANPALNPTLTIRPRYSAAHGTKNYVAISLQSATNTRFFGGTSNLGITVGSYIRIRGSSSNDGVYQVLSVQDGIPNDVNENTSLSGLAPFQYLELSRDIIPEEEGSRITIENVSNLPILHIKYTKVIPN